MYYNRYQLYSPDPYIGGGGAESGSGKGEGEDRDYGDSGVGMTEAEVIADLKKKKKRKKRKKPVSNIVYDSSGQVESTTYNPLQNELYNTISCPCSSYAIDTSDGGIGCERDYFGVKKYINPITINNHFISNNIPKVGDRWRCIDVKCEQGDLKWDTLHVVSVEKNTGETSTSLFNSITSTSNCYIPPTTLKEYGGSDILSEPFIIDGVDINNPEEFVGGKPLFEAKNLALMYNSIRGGGNITSEYNDKGVVKYFPGEYYPEEKLITGFLIGKKDILGYMYGHDWVYKSYASEFDKITVNGRGGIINFKVFGKNKPTFSLTIKDSSGCSILDEKIKNTTLDSNTYNLKQVFPSLPQGKTSETYDLTLTLSADSSYYYNNEIIRAGIVKAKIWQFKDPVFTLTASSSTITNATTTQTDVIVAGRSNARSQDTSSLTHTTAITRTSGSDNYYIKPNTSFKFSDLTTPGRRWIKKIITKQDEDGIPCVSEFIAIGTHTYQGDIEIGMLFTGKVEKTKTIRKSIDLDIHKEPCDDCDENTDIKTNKFEVDNTNDLFPGMKVVGINFVTSLESVDCGRSITLSSKHVINKNTDITFSYEDKGVVLDIVGDLIKVAPCVRFPNNTELTFTKGNDSRINGSIKYDKSGSSAMTVTSVIENANFGQEDTTFTLDPDLFITNKPNICDQHITIGKNSSFNIDFTKCDTDYNRNSKTVAVVDSFKNGEFILARGLYTPNTNFVGKDRLVFTVTDDNDVASDEGTIFLTVK